MKFVYKPTLMIIEHVYLPVILLRAISMVSTDNSQALPLGGVLVSD